MIHDLLSNKKILLLILFAFLASFPFLSGRQLISGDETRVAGIAAGMISSGDFAVPKLNGTPFLEYPPLFYWASAFSMKLFGMTDAAAKLPGAIALFGSILLVFAFAKRLKFTDDSAMTSAIMVLAFKYFMFCRTCMVDGLLSFFILLAVYGFYSAIDSVQVCKKFLWSFCFALGTAAAVMTKGIPGLAIPCAAAFFFLLFRDILERRIHWTNWLLAGCAVLLSLIPVAIWSLMLYNTLGAKAFHEIAIVNSIGRLTGSQGDHVEPFYYYIKKLPEMFHPWLFLIPFGLWQAWKDLRTNKSPSSLLLLCYFLIPILMFTVASGKRQIYLLPLYPAGAILAASGAFFLWNKIPQKKRQNLLPKAIWALLIVFGVLSLVFPLFRPMTFVWTYGALMVLLIITGIFMQMKEIALILVFAMFFPFCEGIFRGRLNHKNSLQPLFEDVAKLQKQGKKVYLWKPAERTSGAAVFYLHKNMPVCTDDKPLPGKDEYFVIRTKEKLSAPRYADHHYLLNGKK